MADTIVRETAYTELETSRFYCTLSLADYKRPNPFSAGQYVPTRVFKLPLPQELRDDTAVGYDNVNLQLIGDIINKNPVEGIASEVLRRSGNIGNALVGVLGNLGGRFTQGVAGVVNDALPADQLTSALQQSIGTAPNPNPSVAFSGPILRDYTLTWTFMPNNDKEARAVRFIIQHLKMSSLPRNSITNAASLLSYPRTCQINFFPWDTGGGGKYGWSRRSIIRAKPAFMGSVNVNYTSGAAPAFFHNEQKTPVITQLTINFKEIEYHLRHDWADNGTGDANARGVLGDGVFEAIGSILDNVPGGRSAIEGAAATAGQRIESVTAGQSIEQDEVEADDE